MLRGIRILLLSALLALALGAGLAGTAAAQQGLPQTKSPASGRFVINGHINSGSLAITTLGEGAFTQDAAQVRIDVSSPPFIPRGTPTQVSVETILVDNVYYLKLAGLGDPAQEKWYSLDLSSLGSTLPGGIGSLLPGGMAPGMTGMVPGTLDPRYAEAYTVTEVGRQQTITGVSATRYDVDVDLNKLMQLMGQAPPEGVQYGSDYKSQVQLWVGDDQYLHQLAMTMQGTITSGDTAVPVDMAITIAFTDLNTPITITAPANAEPLSLDLPSLPGGLGLISELPATLPPIATSPPSGQAPGMPRTGAGGEQSIPLGLLGLGLGVLTMGVVLRRRGARAAG